MELQPHQQRVIDEKNELADKIVKLVTFVWTNPVFNDMDSIHQQLMRDQIDAMARYCHILNARIATFKV